MKDSMTPILFRPPAGLLLKGPATTPLTSFVHAHMTPERDLGPVVLLASSGSGMTDGAGRFRSYFSPGRDPTTNTIEYHRLHAVYPRAGEAVESLPGLEGKFSIVRRNIASSVRLLREGGPTATLEFPDLRKAAALTAATSSYDRATFPAVRDQLLFNSQFYGLPDLYQLFALARVGYSYLAFARERLHHPTRYAVMVGKPGSMQADASAYLEGSPEVFMTALGPTDISPRAQLGFTHDAAMLLFSPNALPPPTGLERLLQATMRSTALSNPNALNPLSPAETDALEWFILGALGLVVPASATTDVLSLISVRHL